MKYSFASWAFLYGDYVKEPWSTEKILEWTARAGYEGTEFTGFHMPSPEEEYDTPEKCRELMQMVKHYGLETVSYSAWCRAAPPATSPQDVYLARFEKALRFCVNCGIPYMRLDSGGNIESLTPEEHRIRFDRTINNWRTAARLAASAGVILAFESEPPMWINKPSEVLAAAEAVNDPAFKLIFDPSHAYLSCVKGAKQNGEKEILPGGVTEYIHMLGSHIGYVHMCDTDGELSKTDSAGTSTHLPLGEGILDLDAIIDALWPYAGKLPWWSIDFYSCRDSEHTGIESLRILKEKTSGR